MLNSDLWDHSILTPQCVAIYTHHLFAGQPHEGSSYAAQKDLQMAFHRLEHVRSRLQVTTI